MAFNTLRFLGSAESPREANALIVGIPYDGTTSYRPGTRFGPDAIRVASDSIESYDPDLDRDLEDYRIHDLGNVELHDRTPFQVVETVRHALRDLPTPLPVLGFGGEHSVTLPLFEHAEAQYPEIAHLIFDAHADMRDSYEGTPYSHASITRRIVDRVGPERIAMFGIRSGLREEWEFMRGHGMLYPTTTDGLNKALQKFGDRPLYITVDLDGFDPSEVPGTGTVEPGGFHWMDFQGWMHQLLGRRVVGADVVELAPNLDPTGRSDVYAARVARSLLLLMLETAGKQAR